MFPNFWPGNDRVRPAKDGAASLRNRSNFSTRNPNAMTAMAVRTQARNVRHAQKKGMSVKTEVEAAVVSIHENTNDGTARVNLRWEGKRQISDFALYKLGSVLNSESEAEHNGWAIVELPAKATVGKAIPLLKEAK
jgi:hypothetical protein